MKKASVSELKNQISRYLDYVKHGETVLVLDRRVPVAELRPITEKSSNGKLVALERKGIIRVGTGEIPKRFFKEKLSGKRAMILDALLEERKKGTVILYNSPLRSLLPRRIPKASPLSLSIGGWAVPQKGKGFTF